MKQKKLSESQVEEIKEARKARHKANDLEIPANIHVIFIPPSTPEMNPIEQIWREIRTKGVRNEVFASLADVVERLCLTIKNLSAVSIHHITARS